MYQVDIIVHGVITMYHMGESPTRVGMVHECGPCEFQWWIRDMKNNKMLLYKVSNVLVMT